jgi:hypothetical protein
VQRLERHRLVVGEAKASDEHHARVRRHVERPPDRGAGMDLAQLDRPAARHHPAPPHVLAERGQGQLLGNLGLADERPGAVPALEVAVADEVVEGGPDGEAGDA